VDVLLRAGVTRAGPGCGPAPPVAIAPQATGLRSRTRSSPRIIAGKPVYFEAAQPMDIVFAAKRLDADPAPRCVAVFREAPGGGGRRR
jgi:hypothetical protein